MASIRTMLQPTTLRNRSPSCPAIPTAAAPIARFCGEIIFPSTPPELLAAASSVLLTPASFAAATCRPPNSALDDVSDPVTATPSQPIIGDRNANKDPAPAAHSPSVIVWPDWFITYASASTEATVRIAHLSWSSVAPNTRSARPGVTPSASIVSRPDISISVPAAGSQLKLNVRLLTASPSGVRTSRPGHWNVVVHGDSASLSLTAGI